jgi:hypothetical protein
MDTNLSGLFGGMSKTPEQYRQESILGMTVSPEKMGQQSLNQQLISQMSNAGANIGSLAGGMMGGVLPEEVKQRDLKEIMKGVNPRDTEQLLNAAAKLQSSGYTSEAISLAEQADKIKNDTLKTQQTSLENDKLKLENDGTIATAKAEVAAKVNRLAALTVKFPEMSVEERTAIAGSPEAFNAMVKPIPVAKTDFQKTIANFPVAEQERLLKLHAALQLDPDPTGQKALAMATSRAAVAAAARDAEEKRLLKSDTMEDNALKLAYAAEDMQGPLDLLNEVMSSAPTDATGRAMQFAFEKLAITDQAALKDQVTTLNSAKVINLLMRLKAQSQTGATGFGAISAPELTLLMADIRVLKPESKDFVKNLQAVKDKWVSIQQRLGAERMKVLDRKARYDGNGKSNQGNNEVNFGSLN